MSLNNLVIPFTELLNDKEKDSINAFVTRLNFQENPSFVFDKKKEENVIDPEVRKSKTCFSNDKVLLSFLDEVLLAEMNKRVGKYTFKLARDYVTFIRYDKGDFFEWHTDFEKLRVNHGENGFKEMHFIYCVQGCLDGGQLLIKKGDDIMILEEARITNSAIVFDKLLEHKGAEVIEGTKIIMTIDLYVISQARLKANLTEESESQLSDLLYGRCNWISFRGDYETYKKVLSTIDDTHRLVPFVELKASVNGNSYRVFGCSNGISYVLIDMPGSDVTQFEFREGTWYLRSENDTTKKRFRLSEHKFVRKDYQYPHKKTAQDYARERYEELKYELSNTFFQHDMNPSEFLLGAIRSLSMGGDDGGIDKFPDVPFSLPGKNSWPHFERNLLPTYFFDKEFEDWGFETQKAGYAYYCNEPHYEQFEVNYRYGLIRSDSELLPKEVEQYPYVSSDEEEEEEDEEEGVSSEDEDSSSEEAKVESKK